MITSPDLDDFTLNKSLNLTVNNANSIPGVVKTLFFDAVSCGGINLSPAAFPSLQTFSCPYLTDAGADVNYPSTIVISGQANLVTLDFPSLVNYNTSQVFNVSYNPALATVNAPNWTGFFQSGFLAGLLNFQGNTSLATVSFPSLSRLSIGCSFAGCTLLSSVQIPLDTVTFITAVRQTFTLNFANCALPTDEVNRLLILIRNNPQVTRGAGGNYWNVYFNGGTNGAPSGDGLVAKQDLFNRGVHIVTN